jgi:hypothetical protein
MILHGPLRTERIHEGVYAGQRRLTDDLVVRCRGHVIAVPLGYITDFSSIPRFARFVVRFDKVDVAGTVHDWLFEAGTLNDLREVNLIWRDIAMYGEYAANKFQAYACWAGLSVGSKPQWDKYRSGYDTQEMRRLLERSLMLEAKYA